MRCSAISYLWSFVNNYAELNHAHFGSFNLKKYDKMKHVSGIWVMKGRTTEQEFAHHRESITKFPGNNEYGRGRGGRRCLILCQCVVIIKRIQLLQTHYYDDRNWKQHKFSKHRIYVKIY